MRGRFHANGRSRFDAHIAFETRLFAGLGHTAIMGQENEKTRKPIA
jgi:hypothetical protein